METARWMCLEREEEEEVERVLRETGEDCTARGN